MNRIALIGYMGSGKSSVGNELSTLMQASHVDLDDYIEKLEQRSIATIFEESGEKYFREIERKAVKMVSKEDISIVSFGGGTPCYFNNMEWINRYFISFYLSTSVEILAKRLQNQKESRPLLSSQLELVKYIEDHLEKREKYYQQANFIINTDELTIPQIGQLIFNKIKKISD